MGEPEATVVAEDATAVLNPSESEPSTALTEKEPEAVTDLDVAGNVEVVPVELDSKLAVTQPPDTVSELVKTPVAGDPDVVLSVDPKLDSKIELESKLLKPEPTKAERGRKKSKHEDVSGVLKLFKLFFGCCMPARAHPSHPASRRASKAQTKDKEPSPSLSPTTAVASGKLGELKEADPEAAEIFAQVEEQLKLKMEEMEPEIAESIKHITFTVTAYKLLVSVVTNYFAKVRISDGPAYIHVRIFKPVEGGPVLNSLLLHKEETDDIEYF